MQREHGCKFGASSAHYACNRELLRVESLMSLNGMMRTGVSAMNAQANRLSTVAENIANSDTSGYKRASTEFSSLILPSSAGSYNSGAVTTDVRYDMAKQGPLEFTNSVTDLAIQGQGFFVVADAQGNPVLTRSGSFVPDGTGRLVNASGFTLLGYSTAGRGGPVVNGFDGLVPVTVGGGALSAQPSTSGMISANLDFRADAVTPFVVNTPPSENGAFTAFSSKFTIASSGPMGTEYSDIYYAKIDDNVWEFAYVDNDSGFPINFPLAGPDVAYTTTQIEFDPTTGAIVSGDPFINLNGAVVDLSQVRQTSSAMDAATVSAGYDFNRAAPIWDPLAGTSVGSANQPNSDYTQRFRLSGFTGLGASVDIDAYATRVSANQWDIAFYNRADATAGGFPYGDAGDPPLAATTVSFDPATGALVGSAVFDLDIPGAGILTVDLGRSVSQAAGTPWDVEIGVVPRLGGAPSPAANQIGSEFTHRTSLAAFNNVGERVLLDIYFSKGQNGYWEVSVFDRANSTDGGFPYGAAGSAPLATKLVQFDLMTGDIEPGAGIDVPIPGGQTIPLDLSSVTSLGYPFDVANAGVDGSAPSKAVGTLVGSDGTVYAQYENGDLQAIYRLAIANVQSPGQLQPLAGNVYVPGSESGPLTIGMAEAGNMGSVISSALEGSNVDIAEELTTMIESQRSYTANSKVFQTGSDLMELLVNLKR
jgi:flagellar hook-basal body protein